MGANPADPPPTPCMGPGTINSTKQGGLDRCPCGILWCPHCPKPAWREPPLMEGDVSLHPRPVSQPSGVHCRPTSVLHWLLCASQACPCCCMLADCRLWHTWMCEQHARPQCVACTLVGWGQHCCSRDARHPQAKLMRFTTVQRRLAGRRTPGHTGSQEEVAGEPLTAGPSRRGYSDPHQRKEGEGPGPGIWVFWWPCCQTQNGR